MTVKDDRHEMSCHPIFAVAIAALLAIPSATLAQGNNCDCQEIVGSCSASISVVPTESTKGSYGADINIQSTVPNCAKVDYYVDGTPYFTILSQGNRGSDRVFGPKPITRANVSDVSCKVCKRAGESNVKPPQDRGGSDAMQPASDKPIDLTGSWSVHQACNYGTGSATWQLAQEAGGTSISGKLSGLTSISSGQVNGRVVTIQASGWFGNQVRMEGRVQSETSMSGTYTQTSVAGVCQWTATRQ